jgi:signal peptidase I
MTDFSEYSSGSEDDQGIQRNKKEYRKREAKVWTISIAAAFIIALFLRFFVFEFIHIKGPSMQPVLYKDEYVFMEKVSYWFSAPKRGDIIVCSFPDSKDSYIKRVVGLPGDSIKVEGGVLYINGTPDYDYFKGYISRGLEETIVPEDCVIVMGDNRNDSIDSRYPNVGPIPYDMIQGKAAFIIWPLEKIHDL